MTEFVFHHSVLARLSLCDISAQEIAALAADEAFGALQAGWDAYDLGRGRALPITAVDTARAVEAVISHLPARPDGDFVDAVVAAALEALGYVYDAPRQIVTGAAR